MANTGESATDSEISKALIEAVASLDRRALAKTWFRWQREAGSQSARVALGLWHAGARAPNAEDFLYRGLIRNKLTNEAVAFANSMLGQDPHGKWLWRLAYAQSANDDEQSALATFERVLKEAPTNMAWYNVFVSLDQLRQYDELARRATQRLSDAPDDELAFRFALLALEKIARNKEARDIALTMLKRFPRSRASVRSAAVTLRNARFFTEALAAAEQLYNLPGRDLDAILQVGEAWEASGSPGEATQFYQEAVDYAPSDGHALSHLASNFIKIGQIKKAEETLSRIQPDDPNYINVLINQANLAVSNNDYQRARPLLDRAVELMPGSDVTPIQGIVHLWTGDYAGAKVIAEALPREFDRGMIGGVANAGLGRLSDAAISFGAAAIAEADDFRPHYNLGLVKLRQGEFSDALSEFRIARQLSPDHQDSLIGELHALLQLERILDAIQLAETVGEVELSQDIRLLTAYALSLERLADKLDDDWLYRKVVYLIDDGLRMLPQGDLALTFRSEAELRDIRARAYLGLKRNSDASRDLKRVLELVIWLKLPSTAARVNVDRLKENAVGADLQRFTSPLLIGLGITMDLIGGLLRWNMKLGESSFVTFEAIMTLLIPLGAYLPQITRLKLPGGVELEKGVTTSLEALRFEQSVKLAIRGAHGEEYSLPNVTFRREIYGFQNSPRLPVREARLWDLNA